MLPTAAVGILKPALYRQGEVDSSGFGSVKGGLSQINVTLLRHI